ncbi:cation diffusion facilitator family transporter [uncultured Thiodictyon sp.]|uniref:cation diffusion facilitator family transporter n=1 Tax=uncultured Thiodictyon sp. TaxID=1846217 RepID=UPI0025F69476|nr:cation diffusion facilitator family transporter [uncultured Thiodictyon sp.]
MRQTLIAAFISASACALFALVLWVLAMREPGLVLIVGAALTTSRAITAALIVAGVRLARHHTADFPEGLYKLENLLALAIGCLIVLGAYELGRVALVAAMTGRDLIADPRQSLVFMAVASVLALGLGIYKQVTARRTGSVALRADATHSFVDFVAGVALCGGLALDLAGVPAADSFAALVASLFVLWAGATISYQAVRVLLDASLERELLDEVAVIAAGAPMVSKVLAVAGRNSGSFRFLNLRLAIAADDLNQAEAATAALKAAIRARITNVDAIIVELVNASAAEPAVVLAATASPAAGVGTLVGPPIHAHGPLYLSATERAEAVSALVSVVMAAAMLIVANMTGSLSILAEGIDTVVDVVAALAVLAGIRLAARRTDGFPLGLYKLENLVATGIGVLILFSGYELAREAIGRMVSGAGVVDNPLLIIVVMAAVTATTAGLAAYKFRVGRVHGSPGLQADARHAWIDACASAGVALGVGLQWAGIPYMDSVTALVVVALLVWGGAELTRDGLRVLLDASLEEDVLQAVRGEAQAQPGVNRVVAVTGRNSGSYRFVTVQIVPASGRLAAAESTAGRVAAAVRERIERIDQVSVELLAA